MSLANAKNSTVWYPHYGSWFIGLIAEAILFTFVLTNGISPSIFVYIQVTVKACRMLSIILLSTVLFTKSSKSIGADEESASLLGHGEANSDETQAPIGTSAYGSITITSNGEAADLEYEAERREKDRKRREILEKRLQNEKSWFAYGTLSELLLHLLGQPQAYWRGLKRCQILDVIPLAHLEHRANRQIDTLKRIPFSYLICGPQRTVYSRQSFSECVSASLSLGHLIFSSHANWE